MEEKMIYGIQQVGIGVENIEDTFKWYAEVLEANVSLFDDSNTSTHMIRYMGGKPHKKKGEYWQLTFKVVAVTNYGSKRIESLKYPWMNLR